MGKNKNSTLNQQSKERQPIDQVRSILNGDPQLKEQINSILNGELSTMIDGVSYSTEQDLIGYLKTISDYDKLVNIREDTSSNSKPRELVENRMSEVLPTISDYDKLVNIRKNTPSNSKPREFVENRMSEVLPTILPTISDYDKLVNIREDTFSDSKPRELVENRMSEVLSTISDYDKLVNIRKNTPSNSKPRELVENRMSEVIDNEMVIIDKECFKSILNNLSKKYIIINDKITNSWKKYLSKVSTK